MDRAALFAELDREEGNIRTPYHDTRGHWTIGRGWNLDANPLPKAIVLEWLQRCPLPADLVDHLTEIAIDRAEQTLDALEPLWRKLDDDRARVLVQVAYNLGPVVFATFRRFRTALREYLETGAEDALGRAADELLDSDAARELPARYGRLAARLRPR